MTAIAGFVDSDKTVWIGGDSAGGFGDTLTVRTDSKVFRRGAFLFGFTSSFRMGQLLRYKLEIPTRSDGQDVEEYMATSFVDAVRQCLKDGGYARKDSERESAGTFLVGHSGRLFVIDADYQVGETRDGYDACGCGTDAVLGALHATRTTAEYFGGRIDPFVRMQLALAAAERHCSGVRSPFIVESLPYQEG